MFPSANALVYDTYDFRQAFLISSKAPPCLQDKVCRSFFTSGIVAEEGNDGGPLGYDRLPLIAFPALVNLAQGAQLACHVLLTQSQNQPLVAKVLAKSLWLLGYTFFSEYE